MEDYYAAIKNVKLATVDQIIESFTLEKIECIKKGYMDEWQVTIGQAEDLLRMSTNENGLVTFIAWQIGDGDEMVLELTPEILKKHGLTNDEHAEYQ